MKKLIPAKLDKQIEGNLCSLNDARIKDLNTDIYGTVTARYYKGIGANGDNIVIVYEEDNTDRTNG